MRVLLFLLIACSAHAEPKEVLVGGPCEDCDAVFAGRPATLTASGRIAPVNEPGESMILEGVVVDAAKKPVAGVIVYAYHTNAKGLYPSHNPKTSAEHHGSLRGFAKTGADGKYRFDTIRPASYPNRKAPQHVHMHVLEPGRCYYYIDEVVFTDDPNLKASEHTKNRGGSGIVTPAKTKTGWNARRDIVLGAGIPDYARCR